MDWNQAEQRVEHRDVDQLPCLTPGAVLQRQQDPDHRGQRTGRNVGDLDAGDKWSAILVAKQVKNAGKGDVVEIVTGTLRVRTGLAIACEGGVDESRILFPQLLVSEADVGHHAGAEAVEHDIGFLYQRLEGCLPVVVLEVERQTLLAAVDRSEHSVHAFHLRLVVANVVTFAGLLDLDDLGTEAGKDVTGVGTGQQATQIENPNVVKRS